MVVGPYQTFTVGPGMTADLFLLRYGNDGQLRSPQTDQLLRNVVGEASDVFLFSHGWNNVFAEALDRYRDFIQGYIAQRTRFEVRMPAGYKPVLIGVIWPSTSFVMPWERGPEIAGVPNAETEEMLRLLSPDDELAELIDGRTALGLEEARQVAKILVDGLPDIPDADEFASPLVPDDLLRACELLADDGLRADLNDFGVVGTPAQSKLEIAGGFSFDPRDMLRVATVWTMKARAGKVGAVGVGPLVRHILRQGSAARLHLVGHSFGARVLLSALASDRPARPACSMLLLQAAVNRWCFAADVDGTGQPGGYQPVLDRVERPVLTTFSSWDAPLTKFFHLAVRRNSLGEPNIAAIGDERRYGALGGYGPLGLGDLTETQSAIVPTGEGPDRYRLENGRRVIALNCGERIGDRPAISGHGDVSNPATWWALHCLTGTETPASG